METMKMYDLSKLKVTDGRSSRSELNENSFIVYIAKKKDGSFGTHTLGFSKYAEFVRENKMFLSIAENTLTGDLFLVFTDESEGKGIEIRRPKAKSGSKRVVITRHGIIRFVADKMGLDYSKGAKEIFNFSKNLSKNSNMLTYKIINKK